MEALEPDYAFKSLDPLYPNRMMIQANSTAKKAAFNQLPSFVDIFDCFLEIAPMHGLDPTLISDQVLVDMMQALEVQ